MSGVEPQGVPSGGSAGDNKGTETETGLTDSEFGEDPDLEVNDG